MQSPRRGITVRGAARDSPSTDQPRAIFAARSFGIVEPSEPIGALLASVLDEPTPVFAFVPLLGIVPLFVIEPLLFMLLLFRFVELVPAAGMVELFIGVD